MTAVDEYIIECLHNNMPVRGVKLRSFLRRGIENKYSKTELYCMVKNVSIPLCDTCNQNKVKLRSLRHGFSKYCSKECYLKAMSKRNSSTNVIKNNKVKAEKKKESYRDLNREKIEKAIAEYTSNDLCSIRSLAEKYMIKSSFIKEELKRRNLIDKDRQKKTFNSRFNESSKAILNFIQRSYDALNKTIEDYRQNNKEASKKIR